ncbi:CBO0543 family protein [Desulfosporosinus fructosivorans]
MVGLIFVITSVLLLNVIAIIIQKKITMIEVYTTSLFVLTLGLTTDIIFDLKYNFYGHFNKGPDLLGLLAIFGIYPSANIIMLNYFPYHKHLKVKILYILIASGAYLFYEWLSLKSGYFYYTVWKLWYSALCYPVLISILALNLTIIKKIKKEK